MDEVGFKERRKSITKNDITVTVSVLSAEETQAVFDTKLYKKKIQPIWVEITNGTDQLLRAFSRAASIPTTTRPSRSRRRALKTWAKKSNQAKRKFYYLNQMPFQLPPGADHGPVLSSATGTRACAGWPYGHRRELAENFEFIVEVPGFKADFHKLEDVVIYAEDDYTDLDEQATRRVDRKATGLCHQQGRQQDRRPAQPHHHRRQPTRSGPPSSARAGIPPRP